MRNLRILSFIFICLFLTGCNNKKVECAYYEKNEKQKTTYDYKFNFNNNGKVLKTLEISKLIEFDNHEDLVEYINSNNDDCKLLLQSFNQQANEYIKCQSKNEDKKISVILTYEYDKLTTDEKNEIFGELTFDKLKDGYDNGNYKENMCVFNSNKEIIPVLNPSVTIDKINNATKVSAEDSANGLIKTAESYIVTYMLENNGDWQGGITFICDGNGCFTNVDGEEISLNYHGIKPTSGEVYLSESGEVQISKDLIINGYTCNMDINGNINCEK